MANDRMYIWCIYCRKVLEIGKHFGDDDGWSIRKTGDEIQAWLNKHWHARPRYQLKCDLDGDWGCNGEYGWEKTQEEQIEDATELALINFHRWGIFPLEKRLKKKTDKILQKISETYS